MKLTAGWISRSAAAGSSALESISTQIGHRFPVSASITTTEALLLVYWRRWLIGTALLALTSATVLIPGTFTRITEPGLNPSAAL